MLLWNKAKEAPLFTFKRDLIFTFPGYDVLLFGYEVMLFFSHLVGGNLLHSLQRTPKPPILWRPCLFFIFFQYENKWFLLFRTTLYFASSFFIGKIWALLLGKISKTQPPLCKTRFQLCIESFYVGHPPWYVIFFDHPCVSQKPYIIWA